MNNQLNKQVPYKNKFLEEIRSFLLTTLYLSLIFGAFTIYRRILLNDFSNATIHYGYSVLEALIMAKVILFGKMMRLGERYASKPLIIPVFFKTVIFCLLLFILEFVGHVIFVYFQGVNVIDIFNDLNWAKLNAAMAESLVMFFVFSLFFSVQEVSRVLGPDKLFNLFFKRID